ncbi:MAG TPA: right-handed parallel beta-helix repeat-containing protein, partial [Coleofasciculaceae cyanobacterium]
LLTRLLMVIILLKIMFSGLNGLLATPVQAGNSYYVATNGSDSNPGTESQPFATLSKAVSEVEAGDTVYVRGGTYYLKNGVWIGKKGNSSAHITFQSYPGETAILDGKKMSDDNDALTLGGEYIDIKNFEIRNTTRMGINIWGGKHVQILNNIVHDSEKTGIFMGYTDTSQLTDILVDGNTVYNNCLNNSDRKKSEGWPSGIAADGDGDIRITNNKVYNNYGEGIGSWMSDGLISGNTVYDNYSVEIYLTNTTNTTVEKNLVYTLNNANFYRFDQAASGIQLANEGQSNKLDNNRIINNIVIGGREGLSYYSSYGYGGGLKNTIIANNTFYKATRPLLLIEEDAGHKNTVIANNIFYQTGDVAMTDVEATSGLKFHNNVWYGGEAGSASGKDDVNADPLLVNPGTTVASDYKLKAGSPAIDAGSKLNQVATDYRELGRPVGNRYDIGAYEYVSE